MLCYSIILLIHLLVYKFVSCLVFLFFDVFVFFFLGKFCVDPLFLNSCACVGISEVHLDP